MHHSRAFRISEQNTYTYNILLWCFFFFKLIAFMHQMCAEHSGFKRRYYALVHHYCRCYSFGGDRECVREREGGAKVGALHLYLYKRTSTQDKSVLRSQTIAEIAEWEFWMILHYPGEKCVFALELMMHFRRILPMTLSWLVQQVNAFEDDISAPLNDVDWRVCSKAMNAFKGDVCVQ